jgi:fibronectin-binding autotransporter adhesin
LNLANAAAGAVNLTINAAGSTSYSGNLTGAATVTKLGVGTQVLSGANTYSGTTQMQAGRLVLLGNNARNPIFSGAGADITGGKLIFDYSTGTDPTTQVVSALTAGFNQTPTKFATGPLRTSAPTTDKGLGWSKNAAASQISVFYTFFGDADGDGTVNALDFNRLASNFGGSGKGWSDGDFDYSGNVNTLDFNVLALNFNKTMPAPAPALGAPALGALVPEPSTGLLALATGLLAGRRRRHSSR